MATVAASLNANPSNDTVRILADLDAVADLVSVLNDATAASGSSAAASSDTVRLSLLQFVASAATSVVGTVAATGVTALTSTAVDSITASLAAFADGAELSPFAPADVDLALSTLTMVVSSDASLVSSSGMANVAAATASLLSTSADALSPTAGDQALNVLSAVAASQVAFETAGVVSSGLAALLAAPAAQDPSMQTQGMSIVTTLAATLNADAAASTTVSSDGVRDSLLSLVASVAQTASAAAAVAEAAPPTSALLDGIISAATLLVNASGAVITAESSASPLTLQAATVNLVLESIQGAVTTGGDLSPTSVANLAAMTAAAVTDAPALTANGAVAAASLFFVAANASQGQSLTVASNVVFGVSSLSLVDAAVPAANASASPVPFVTALQPALDAVSDSLLSQLMASASSAITVTSPNVNVSLQTVAAPAAADGTVTIENVVVPASVLPSGATVYAVHYQLNFDPHAGLADTSGVTRLEFHDASGPLQVQGLSTLITLELPSMVLPDGTVATAQFWDASAAQPAYSSNGVVTMPNAAPAGVDISWNPTFDATANSADLNLAWQLSGYAWEGCAELVLNCSDPADRDQYVSLNSTYAIGNPALGCDDAPTGVRRILHGHNCSLWVVDEAGCYWNATQQAFRGSACIATNATRMATRHLTDFMAGPKPQIVVAAPSQLNLSVNDLARLRLLVAVVCILFGVMHCGALLLSRRDAVEQRNALRTMMSPECGCSLVDGSPVWRLKQEPFVSDSDVVHGSAVVVAGIMGVPFVRLAAAVPERMLGVASLQAAMGRVGGLSATALKAHAGKPAAKEAALLTTSDAEAGATARPRVEQLLQVTGGPAAAEDCPQAPDINEVASTALCHALQLAYGFGDGHEVAEQQAAYLRRLRSAGMDVQQYRQLFAVFKVLSNCTGLRAGSNWWPAARLWRIVLSADDGGFWDADSGIAAGLLASTQQVARPDLHGVQLVVSLLQGVASSVAAVFLGSASAATASEMLYEGRRTTPLVITTSSSSGEKDVSSDCPLAFSAEAIESTVPEELLAELSDRQAATRIWTTALVLAVLPHLLATWCEDEDAAGRHRSLADNARSWLTEQLAGKDDLLSLVQSQATLQTACWNVCHDRLLTISRGAHITTSQHHALLMKRCWDSIVHSLLTRHPTVGVFTSEEVVGSRRWQSFMVLVSAIIAVLMSSIWLYYSRAYTCCLEVRSALGCDLDVTVPCRGYAHSCADLALYYYRFAAAAIAYEVRGVSGLQCSAFPNDRSARDTFLAGLITAAVSLPITAVMHTCFALSLATDQAQLHGRSKLKRWTLLNRIFMGRAPWEHVTGCWHGLKLRVAGSWSATAYHVAIVWLVDACAALVRCCLCCCGWARKRKAVATETPADAAPPEDEAAELLQDAAEFSRVTTGYRRGAMFVLYAVWGIFVWIIFVYGKLIYQLLGTKAEERFVRTWGVGIGLGQAHEARDLVVNVLQVALALTILEVAWVSTNMHWMENNVGYMSVHASIAPAATRRWWRKARTYSRFYKCVRSAREPSSLLGAGTDDARGGALRLQGRVGLVKCDWSAAATAASGSTRGQRCGS